MGRPRINLEGRRFGRWTVLKYECYKISSSIYHVACDCGTKKLVKAHSLKNGQSVSCGCYAKEVQNKRANPTKQLLLNIFKAMHRRCNNPKHESYHRYGGRGISVCKEWKDRHVFIDFALKNGWKHGLQMDRTNNDGNYEPNNVRFVTRSVNVKNSTNMIRKRNAKGQFLPVRP